MPTASVTVDHLAEESLPSTDGGTTVTRRERCERRFDQHRPLRSFDFASKYIKQWHRPYPLLLSVLVLEDLKANQGTTGFFRTCL